MNNGLARENFMFTKVFLIVGHQNPQVNYKAQTFINEVLEVVATI